MEAINNEALIACVEARPALWWQVKHKRHKNTHMTRCSWIVMPSAAQQASEAHEAGRSHKRRWLEQIGFLLYPTGLTPVCYELQPSSRAASIGDKYLLMHPVSVDESYRPFHDGAGVTSTDNLGSPMTTLWSGPIKQDAYGTAGGGHGSIAKMQPSNPFLLILQVGFLLFPTGLTPVCYELQPSSRAPSIGDKYLLMHPVSVDESYRPFHDGAGVTSTDNLGSPMTTLWSGPIKQDAYGTAGSGHGSIAKMQPSNPFLFILQVSRRYDKSFRSNDVCLILLPCPRSLRESFCKLFVFLRMLLLLGGDVDLNPGPTLDGIAEQLKLIARDIQEIKKEKSITNTRLIAIDKKLEKIAGIEKQISENNKRIFTLEKNLMAMEKKIEDLENRSRRSNLVIYGVEEQQKESTDMLLEFVEKKILDGILQIKTKGIERIHRLGKKKQTDTSRPRPVILKLLDCRDKVSILKHCTKLKGSGFYISKDFSRSTREIRKKLWDRTKEYRRRQERVSLVYDKVRVNGQLFAWDSDHEDLVAVQKNEEKDALQKRVTRSRQK
ncbi:uncharacterized protein [Dermacentor albipictus]|uniref:uncharacterized protein n=1 Tax=Dermacentor albipictus TaxID=60249 RepID=UPI0038FD3D4B